jgi:hypothetical protein
VGTRVNTGWSRKLPVYFDGIFVVNWWFFDGGMWCFDGRFSGVEILPLF